VDGVMDERRWIEEQAKLVEWEGMKNWKVKASV
jgi:hypothetical protein